jgi:small GTP-binding protein
MDEKEKRIVTVEMIREFLHTNEKFLKYKDISVKTRENLYDLLHSIFDVYKFKEVNMDSETRDYTIYESEKNNKTSSLYVNNVYKIILLGDGTVGKTSFFKRYFYDDFDDNYMMTMGVCDKFKFVKINGNEIKLQLWDTAGQERFRSLPRKYYEHADGIILMYDVTDKDSFNNVTKWMKDITENSKRKTIIYLVGNKIDLIDQKIVEFSEALEMATKYNTHLYEISCKFDINVSEVLKKLTHEIYNDNIKNKKRWSSSFSVEKKDKCKSYSCCGSK